MHSANQSNALFSHLVWTEFILENETFECKKRANMIEIRLNKQAVSDLTINILSISNPNQLLASEIVFNIDVKIHENDVIDFDCGRYRA